jgi:hypothetical protein
MERPYFHLHSKSTHHQCKGLRQGTTGPAEGVLHSGHFAFHDRIDQALDHSKLKDARSQTEGLSGAIWNSKELAYFCVAVSLEIKLGEEIAIEDLPTIVFKRKQPGFSRQAYGAARTADDRTAS